MSEPSQPPQSPYTTDAELLAVLGPDLLRWVLNDQLPEEIAPGDDARQQVRGALGALVALALDGRGHQERADSAGAEVDQRFQLTHFLGSSPSGDGFSLAVQFRLQAGGVLPAGPASEDVFLASLFDMALDAFPLQLLPPLKVDPHFPLTGQLYRHPSMSAFCRAALEDGNLSPLFPDALATWDGSNDGNLLEIQTYLTWSTGSGGTLQLVMVPASALQYTFVNMRLAGQFTVEHLAEHLTATVALMRRFAQDRRAKALLIVGLGNLSLADAVPQVSLPQGRVIAPIGLYGLIPSLDWAVSAVLLLEADVRLVDIIPAEVWRAGSGGESEMLRRMRHRQPTVMASERAISREVARARLSMALASSPGSRLAPTVRSRLVMHPLSGGGGSWSFDPYGTAPSPAVVVDGDRAAAITDWAARTIAHPDSMWMGARRLIGAMAERLDPLDGFVDAVVCWENLLGGDIELTFRVSAALAALLEPHDTGARLETFKELKDLYRVRSQLVHGSKEPPPTDAQRHRERAIDVAIAAMRAIYERPELLECATSDERNRRLLLGA